MFDNYTFSKNKFMINSNLLNKNLIINIDLNIIPNLKDIKNIIKKLK